MAGGAVIMISLSLRDGLIYIDAILAHGNNSVTIKNALVDTGSSSTVISRDIAHNLGLKPEPIDIINSVQGIGGSETVIEKKIDVIEIDNVAATNFNIQIGAMQYGFEIDAIVGTDILKQAKAIVNLGEMILTAAK